MRGLSNICDFPICILFSVSSLEITVSAAFRNFSINSHFIFPVYPSSDFPQKVCRRVKLIDPQEWKKTDFSWPDPSLCAFYTTR